METLIALLIFVIVVGLIYWIITMIPLPEPFKQILTVVFIVLVVIYLLSWLAGFVPPLPLRR
jgi:hypothetical protein